MRILLSLFLLLPAAGRAGETTKAAPAFSLPDAQGRVWTVKDAQSKPLLLDFWATWCRPCLDAMPELNNFHKKHQAQMQLLGMNIDIQGWSVATPMAQRYGLLYPVLVAPPKLSKDYGAKGYPFMAVVYQGRVVKTLSGLHKVKDLEAELKPWLK
jgi:thiol-disulfide isomerase/thioredoxin